MRHLPLILLFCLCPVLGWSASPTLAEVEAMSQNLTSWQADFTQITTIAVLGEDLKKTGTIAAKKPKQFHIEYTSEPQKTYLYNGKRLWIYQVQSKSVLEYNNPETFISAEALSFLSGMEKLSTLFAEVKKQDLPEFRFNNKQLTAMALTPLNANASIQYLVLGLDKNLNTEEAWLWTPSGNTTHYLFTRVQKNPPLDASLFSWQKTDGIKVMQQSF